MKISAATAATGGSLVRALEAAGEPGSQAAAPVYRNRRESMAYRRLGRTNWMASRLAFGCGAALTGGKGVRLLERTFEAGVNYYDTGRPYGDSERQLAPFLKAHRDDIWVVSKAAHMGWPDKRIRPDQGREAAKLYSEQLEESLRELQTDYIDAYMIMGIEDEGFVRSQELYDAFLQARPEAALREALGIPADALVVGKIARLFELKGHDYLIQAAPAIVAEFPSVRFLLVGDGALRGRLEQEIAAAGLADHFTFAGLVPPADVPRYTALMDVLVHLSLREGLPRTIVQALAAGVPAVGFDLDGTPEVVLEGRTGFVCAPGDVAAVQTAVRRLLRDPELRRGMGESGRALVTERFSWQRMVDVIEQQYYECLASGRGDHA